MTLRKLEGHVMCSM